MTSIDEETYFHQKLVPKLNDLTLKYQPLIKLNHFDFGKIF